MAKHRILARTASEADQRGHKKANKFSFAKLTAAEKSKGVQLSKKGAKPGDVAWVGPCEGGIKTVCYYDQNMDPSDCRDVSC